jgi:gliding motility-associated-like protein
MENLKVYISIVLFLSFFKLTAQTQIGRSVISSGGQESSSSTIKLSSTIGEGAVATKNGNYVLTEGFQQPIVVSGLITFRLNLQKASCLGKSNGFAIVDSIVGCNPPYQVRWSNGQSDTIARNLAAGNYSVQVVSNDGCQSQLQYFSIGVISEVPCTLKFYSGITPNNDGINDSWIIDNVDAFAENQVEIFDRRGVKVYSENNYDNQSVVWEGESNDGLNLPPGTYFFIFKSGDFVEKGWIELSR